MRPIDADVLISWTDKHYAFEKFTVAYFANMIKDMPTIEERKWIPCSERLPEIDKEVLVTDGKICWVCSLFESPDIEDGFHQWEDNYGHWHEFDTWIAWMPLPEPYAERREE